MNFCQISHALATKFPQEKTYQMTDEELNQKTENLFIKFISGVIKAIQGENAQIPIKSQNLEEVSSTIDFYQAKEMDNNPNYANSSTKEKIDFGARILSLIAGILSVFGI